MFVPGCTATGAFHTLTADPPTEARIRITSCCCSADVRRRIADRTTVATFKRKRPPMRTPSKRDEPIQAVLAALLSRDLDSQRFRSVAVVTRRQPRAQGSAAEHASQEASGTRVTHR